MTDTQQAHVYTVSDEYRRRENGARRAALEEHLAEAVQAALTGLVIDGKTVSMGEATDALSVVLEGFIRAGIDAGMDDNYTRAIGYLGQVQRCIACAQSEG